MKQICRYEKSNALTISFLSLKIEVYLAFICFYFFSKVIYVKTFYIFKNKSCLTIILTTFYCLKQSGHVYFEYP